MWSPELIVSIGGFAITFATLLYKFGRLEGKITQQLEEHERRLNEIQRSPTSRYAGV